MQNALAAVLFAVIGWADYLDGFTARLTGQFSRLGALLDPIVDRLLVVSGMVVCLGLRAAAALGARAGDRARAADAGPQPLQPAPRDRDQDQLGWAPRRRADDGAPFFAMAGVHWLALVLLYVGLALLCWRLSLSASA